MDHSDTGRDGEGKETMSTPQVWAEVISAVLIGTAVICGLMALAGRLSQL